MWLLSCCHTHKQLVLPLLLLFGRAVGQTAVVRSTRTRGTEHSCSENETLVFSCQAEENIDAFKNLALATPLIRMEVH